MKNRRDITAKVKGKDLEIELTYEISDRQVDVLLYGGFINYKKAMEKVNG